MCRKHWHQVEWLWRTCCARTVLVDCARNRPIDLITCVFEYFLIINITCYVFFKIVPYDSGCKKIILSWLDSPAARHRRCDFFIRIYSKLVFVYICCCWNQLFVDKVAAPNADVSTSSADVSASSADIVASNDCFMMFQNVLSVSWCFISGSRCFTMFHNV